MSVASPVAKWIVRSRDFDAEAKLRSELGIGSLLSMALVNRGITDPAEADTFLNPSLSDLHSPHLLPDFDKAIKILGAAKEQGHKVFVHGDYDVDGVTSAALLTRFLKRLGLNVKTHVPHRMKEGYGISQSAVESAREFGANVFLTCDCGGSAFEEIQAARDFGMVTLVTDHHHVGDQLPNADAFVNPHRPDSTYPFSDLCGVGVAFKLCQGFVEDLGMSVENYHRAYLDLVALGTVADVMPLVGENRILVKHGTPLIGTSKKPGLRALVRESGLEETALKGLNSGHLSFQLSPRINAAGRIDDAAVALELLLSENDDEATRLAKELDRLNSRRKEEGEKMVAEAIEMAESSGQTSSPVIIVGSETWHPGIVGIVAGRLKEKFNRPTFVMTIDPVTGAFKGSGRSIPGFNLAEAIKAHPELMEGGGHARAAGMEVDGAFIEEARQALIRYAMQTLTEDDFVPHVFLAAEVGLDELSFSSVKEMERMAPFGEGNREPTLFASAVTLERVQPTRNPEHAFAFVSQNGGPAIKGKGWRLGPRLANTTPGQRLDLAFEAEINDFRGTQSVEMSLRDFRPA